MSVDEKGRVLRFVEKPPADQVFTDLADRGLLICDPELLSDVPAATVYDFGRDLLPALLEKGCPVMGCPIQDGEYVIDIGTPSGYLRAQQLAAARPVTV